ncbi:MAG: lipopolysaccharide biosynthesis protein [Muribaculaceae bacterium]|nr:lipopolysaccharide biosynthesis protein [Muribaculaceae bacterium]
MASELRTKENTPFNNSTRIARNTLFLYIRMLLSIIINLVTVRILWLALGVEDYGVFTLVGGFVTLFSFISSSMTGAIQRYMSYGMGKDDKEYIQKIFSISLRVQILLMVIVLLLGETIGLWAVNHWLKIPIGKEFATNCVYQSCLFSFLITIISVPYNASIVAHEHMHIYGYYGILEVILKLGIVLLISILPSYRLVAYSILLVLISLLMRILYQVYCYRHFPETHYKKYSDPSLIKGMLNFQKWTFVGLLGFSARDSGITIVLNRFFSMDVIAAKGISGQVGNVITGFASNFTMALNPQIIKLYASNNIEAMIKLTFNGCKYAFILMSLPTIPLIIASSPVLSLWLKDPATYTSGFMKLTLLLGLMESVVSPITTAIQATGKIKWFQILISILMLSIIPVSWIMMEFIKNPYIIFYVMLVVSGGAIILRLIIMHNLIKFSYKYCFKTIYLRTLPAMALSFAIINLIYTLFPSNLLGLIGFIISSCTILLIINYIISLNTSEKRFVINKIHILTNKISNSNR